MNKALTQIILITSFLLSFDTIAQNTLLVNGETLSYDCAKIILVDELDTLKTDRVKIYHAEINNNCLELGIVYGDCNTNIELVTDNKLIESNTLKLYFLLRYINHTPCHATLKTKLTFDLTPFKNMRTEKSIVVSLMGEKFNLSYK